MNYRRPAPQTNGEMVEKPIETGSVYTSQQQFQPQQHQQMAPVSVGYSQQQQSSYQDQSQVQRPQVVQQQLNVRNPRQNISHRLGAAKQKDLDIFSVMKNLPLTNGDPSNLIQQIFVSSIPPYVSRFQLLKVFSTYGKVVAISEVFTNPDVNAGGTCVAYVQYTHENPEAVSEAVTAVHNNVIPDLDVAFECYKATEVPFVRPAANNGPPPLSNRTISGKMRQRSGQFNPNAELDKCIQQTSAVKRGNLSNPGNNQSMLLKRRRDLPPAQTSAVPDVLVCGICHKIFHKINDLINHKNNPCLPKYKCSCVDQKLPPMISCVVCYKGFQTPWELIVHTQKVHSIEICAELAEMGTAEYEASLKAGIVEIREENVDFEHDLVGDE